jgi:hypothetical protein
MNIEIIAKDWMTKNKIELQSNATVPFEFGYALKGPHPHIVELIGKKETITRIQKLYKFIVSPDNLGLFLLQVEIRFF